MGASHIRRTVRKGGYGRTSTDSIGPRWRSGSQILSGILARTVPGETVEYRYAQTSPCAALPFGCAAPLFRPRVARVRQRRHRAQVRALVDAHAGVAQSGQEFPRLLKPQAAPFWCLSPVFARILANWPKIHKNTRKEGANPHINYIRMC